MSNENNIEVTKEQFKDFLQKYPNSIEHEYNQICEPPISFYHDWSLSKDWKKSIIAWHSYDWLNKKDEYYLINKKETE